MGNWQARHDLSCLLSRNTSTQTNQYFDIYFNIDCNLPTVNLSIYLHCLGPITYERNVLIAFEMTKVGPKCSKTQNQDQDSLLVKRRNDNHSPGLVIRELVPSSHQRSKLSTTILSIFSWWDQRIGEGIQIPDSIGEEATFINICIGNGSLKCHRVLISITPSFGDKVICLYTGFTFKTFI